MIKGAQKKIVVVRTADSRVFEEALFVLRKDITMGEKDMVAEANRIIEGYESGSRGSVGPRFKRVLFATSCFLCGSAFGGGLVAIAVMFAGG